MKAQKTQNNVDNFSESIGLFLQKVGLSAYLSDEALQRLEDSLEILTVDPSSVLFRQGERNSELYLVWDGKLEIYTENPGEEPFILGYINPGEWVGEIQVLWGGEKTVSVRAVNQTQLLHFPKHFMTEAIKEFSSLGQYFIEIVQKRLREMHLNYVLTQIFKPNPIYLAELKQADEWVQVFRGLAKLKQTAEWMQISRGECLVRQGEQGDSLYIVLNGRFNTMIEDEAGNVRVLGQITQGEIIGELAVLTNEPRSASVYAMRDSLLIRYSNDTFKQLINEYPSLLTKITERLIERFKKRESGITSLEEKFRNITILAHQQETPLGAFCEQLVKALSTQGNLLYLNRNRVMELLELPNLTDLSPETPQGLQLQLWLERQEYKYRFILFEADPTDSTWTQYCIQQADHLVWIAQASEDPSPTVLEQQVEQQQTPAVAVEQTLILIHPEATQLPAQTQRWLQPRTLDIHHHIRSGHPGDIERVARFLAGRAVGVALGGGGGRGAAHIGVLQALKQMNIPVDFIGGTSIGGLIAAQYAMGWDIPTMIERSKEITIKNNPFKAYTIPIVSLMDQHKLDRGIKKLYGETQIEDLWLNYFCVSTNISKGKKQVYRQGAVWKGVRATIALPAIFVPFIENGQLFIDGGGLDNDPSLIMKDLNPGPIILCSITPPRPPEISFSYEELPSSWKVLWSWLNPFVKPIEFPNIVDIITLSMGTNNMLNSQKAYAAADIRLIPPLEGYEVYNFEAMDEIIQVAYDYTLEQLKDGLPSLTVQQIS